MGLECKKHSLIFFSALKHNHFEWIDIMLKSSFFCFGTMKLDIFQIKKGSKKMSFELFEYSPFFFYQHTRQIAPKSNEKEKEKLYPLIRLIKHGKTTNFIGTPLVERK